MDIFLVLFIRHWAIAASVLVVFVFVTSLASLAVRVPTTMGKVALICVVIAIDALLIK